MTADLSGCFPLSCALLVASKVIEVMKSNVFILLVLALALSLIGSCKERTTHTKGITLEDIFEHPPITIKSVAKSYTSRVTAEAIHDMDETILCMSTTINDNPNTYFIQPDKVDLKDLSYRYDHAEIVDMKSALLLRDTETGKKTLIYLPGRFPIDSISMKVDVMIPVLGISRYQSELEKISSRWTQIVCKCVDMTASTDVYKDRTVHDCDIGGPGISECTLSLKDAVASCQTDCKAGATACCWFEF